MQTTDQIQTWLEESNKLMERQKQLNKKIGRALAGVQAEGATFTITGEEPEAVTQFKTAIANLFNRLPDAEFPHLYLPYSEIQEISGSKKIALQIIHHLGYRVTPSKRYTYPKWDGEKLVFVNAHGSCYKFSREYFVKPVTDQ